MTNLAASNGAEWISSEVPKPGADGWIVLFDGKRLFGCSAPTADIASGKIRIQDGCLRLDSGKLYFNIIGRDVMIRARMKKMSCQNCGVRVRDDGKGCDNGKGRDCGATFDGGNLFIVGHHIDGPFMHLASVHARGDYDEFFEMEFDAEGGNLTLKIDGQIICHAQDNSITEGAMCADANGGSALFQSIEARILDKTPSLGTSATGPAATPTPSAIGQVKYAITDLGTLGGGFSCPKAINDSGLVVGYANTSASQSHAFLSDGKAPMRDLGTLDSTRVLSTAMDINNNGQIVGWSWSTNVKAHAFLCGASTPMKDLGTLSGADSWAGCINDRGEIVGEANLSDGQYRAFLYTGSGPMRSIGTLGGTKSAAASINNSGQIVGWSHLSAASSGYAFLYSDSSPMRSLGTLGGSTSHACGINDRGQVVGWSTTRNGTTHAFLYAGNGPMRDLGTLGGTTSGAWCIDNDGHILGYSYDSSDNDHPFLYSGSGPMRDLNSLIPASSGWTLISTKGMEADPPKRMINSSGQIVCLGRNGLGQSHALLLSPLPSKLQDAASAKSDSTKNASASQRAATPD
jgi:probable HAF family extracellular repeat protein